MRQYQRAATLLFLLGLIFIIVILPALIATLDSPRQPIDQDSSGLWNNAQPVSGFLADRAVSSGGSRIPAGTPLKNLDKYKIIVYLPDSGRSIKLSLEDYLIGVVGAEMSPTFELEALKAQAVAARTYALRRVSAAASGRIDPHHRDADICTDPAHCQAWIGTTEMRRRWGFWKAFSYRRRLASVVRQTSGLVLLYQGRLAEPVYHSTSPGQTEDAAEVWSGPGAPYLQSVPSPWDRQAPKYKAEKVLTLAEVRRRLELAALSGSNNPSGAVSPPPPSPLSDDPGGGQGTAVPGSPAGAQFDANVPWDVLAFTPTGRLKTVQVADRLLSGEEFRRLLGLNSSRVDWRLQGDKIVFTTYGYGHGVGLSQYGAQGQAREGRSFRDILTYYYSGVSVEPFDA